MVQYEFRAKLRNTGHVRVYLVADGFVATGLKYTTQGTPLSFSPFKGATQYDRDARIALRQPVFRGVEMTRYADASLGGGYSIDSGEEIPFSGIFLVRRGEFDALTLDGSVAYAKSPHQYPTRVVSMKSGAVYFVSKTDDPDYSSIQVTLDRASLW